MQTHRADETCWEWWVIDAYTGAKLAEIFCRVGQIASAMQTHRADETCWEWWVIVAYTGAKLAETFL